ncbi:hypothetical protein BESB_006330 [Besnoitia besnoiti]|uniref:V-SNARE coiled-coil homology domain-containing protein n=1 Tax=Besnoitia besnoiti TaxID=94643 RepID=A0A2A9MQJ4_BESBE|nr:hypothetical protein BESB_006330 [Besnoitia besnoiti]PFH38292.1 hypothetical protein BESB_006330 [Besnoitia besnoiti]
MAPLPSSPGYRGVPGSHPQPGKTLPVSSDSSPREPPRFPSLASLRPSALLSPALSRHDALARTRSMCSQSAASASSASSKDSASASSSTNSSASCSPLRSPSLGPKSPLAASSLRCFAVFTLTPRGEEKVAVAWRVGRAQRPAFESVLRRVAAAYRARLLASSSGEEFLGAQERLRQQVLRWTQGAVFCLLEAPRAGVQFAPAEMQLYVAVSDSLQLPPAVVFELMGLACQEYAALTGKRWSRVAAPNGGEPEDSSESEASAPSWPGRRASFSSTSENAESGAGAAGERNRQREAQVTPATHPDREQCEEEASPRATCLQGRRRGSGGDGRRDRAAFENFLHLLLILPEPRLLSSFRRQIASSPLSTSLYSVASPAPSSRLSSSRASPVQGPLPSASDASFGSQHSPSSLPRVSSPPSRDTRHAPARRRAVAEARESTGDSPPASGGAPSDAESRTASAAPSGLSPAETYRETPGATQTDLVCPSAVLPCSIASSASPLFSLPFRFLHPEPSQRELAPAKSPPAPPAASSLSQIAAVTARVSSLNALLEDNLRLLYSSSASLEVLEQKTSSLSSRTHVFVTTSRQVRRVMWLKSKKMYCVVAGAVVLILVVAWIL